MSFRYDSEVVEHNLGVYLQQNVSYLYLKGSLGREGALDMTPFEFLPDSQQCQASLQRALTTLVWKPHEHEVRPALLELHIDGNDQPLQELLKDVAKRKGLDFSKLLNSVHELRKTTEPLNPDSDALAQSLVERSKLPEYDVSSLREDPKLLALKGDTLSESEFDELLVVCETEPQSVGRRFGRKMRDLGPILKVHLR